MNTQEKEREMQAVLNWVDSMQYSIIGVYFNARDVRVYGKPCVHRIWLYRAVVKYCELYERRYDQWCCIGMDGLYDECKRFLTIVDQKNEDDYRRSVVWLCSRADKVCRKFAEVVAPLMGVNSPYLSDKC